MPTPSYPLPQSLHIYTQTHTGYTGKGKGKYICILLPHEVSLRHSGMSRIVKGLHSFTCTPEFHPQAEWPIPAILSSQPQLVLIYWPWRDGRLSKPWCEAAQAEIQACNPLITNQVSSTQPLAILYSSHWLIVFIYTQDYIFMLYTLYVAWWPSG